MIIVEPWMAIMGVVVPVTVIAVLLLIVRDQIMDQQVKIYEWLTNEVRDEDAS